MFARSKAALFLTALALCVQSVSSLRAAGPAVLQQIPSDASVVIVVNDLQGFSTKLGAAAGRLKIPAPPDLLGIASRQFGLAKGFDRAGSAAMVLYFPKPGEDAEGSLQYVVLVPATDPAALLEAFEPSRSEGGVAKVTLPNSPDAGGYAAIVGKEGDANRYIAYAVNKTALLRYVGRTGSLSEKLSPQSLKSFSTNDAVLYTNVPEFSATAISSINGVKPMILAAIQQGGADPKTAAMQQRIFGLYFDAATQLMTDGDNAMLTFRLNDAGAAIGFSGTFKPETPTGRLVAAQKVAPPASLEGLPAGPLLAAGGFAWDPESFAKIFGQVSDAMSPAGDGNDAAAQAFQQAMGLQRQMMGLTAGMKFAFYQPEVGAQGLVHGVIIADTTDSAKYLDLMQQSAKLNFGGSNPTAPDLKMKVDIQEHAVSYKQVTLNKYTIAYSVESPGGAPTVQAQQTQAILKTIYGADGISLYAGVLDKRQLIYVVGGDEKMAQAAIDAAVSHSTALSKAPEIAAASGQALPNFNSAAYLPITRWVAIGQAMMAGKTAAEARAVPADMAVSSISVTGSTFSAEMFVPTAMMTNISDVIQGARAPVTTDTKNGLP